MKRSFLTALNLDKEAIDQIMSEHGATVETLKEKAKETEDALRAKATDLQAQIDNSSDADSEWKTKYSALKGEFDTYKTEITTKETSKAQDLALAAALKAAGANEKFISLVIDKVDRTKAVFDGDIEKGFTVKNSDDIVKPVKEQYGDIFGTVQTVGAGVATPPKGEITKATTGNAMNDFILKAAGKI